MAKAKAKSKPCAKAKCKGKGLGKGKGRGKGKGLGTGTSLQGLARRQAVARKRKAQVLEEIPGPTVEQDPLVAELKLEGQLLDKHVDEASEADPAPSAEPSVDAAPSQHAVVEQSASLPPAGVVEELSEACAPESEQHGAARPLFARADGDAEEPSAVAQEATAVQAQPSNETLPDPMSGPRETGMAQPSSSSGSAPVQGPNPASSHHGQASQLGPREHGPHLNSTPDFLSELDPPEDFKLRLSFNDRRFKAEIMTKEYLSRDGKNLAAAPLPVSDQSGSKHWPTCIAGHGQSGKRPNPKGNSRPIVSLVLSLRLFWNALHPLSTPCLRLQSTPSSCLFQVSIVCDKTSQGSSARQQVADCSELN